MNWEKFMLESNRIEGEDRLNPGDEKAFKMAMEPIESLDDILKIHRALTEHLKQPWCGILRLWDVCVGMSMPPKHLEVPRLMDWYIKQYPKMNSVQAHDLFELIHPFLDFNGRTGRLIWLNKASRKGYKGQIPFLQAYYYQKLQAANRKFDGHGRLKLWDL